MSDPPHLIREVFAAIPLPSGKAIDPRCGCQAALQGDPNLAPAGQLRLMRQREVWMAFQSSWATTPGVDRLHEWNGDCCKEEPDQMWGIGHRPVTWTGP